MLLHIHTCTSSLAADLGLGLYSRAVTVLPFFFGSSDIELGVPSSPRSPQVLKTWNAKQTNVYICTNGPYVINKSLNSYLKCIQSNPLTQI